MWGLTTVVGAFALALIVMSFAFMGGAVIASGKLIESMQRDFVVLGATLDPHAQAPTLDLLDCKRLHARAPDPEGLVAFASRHLHGSVSFEYGNSFSTYLGWLLDPARIPDSTRSTTG